MVGRRGREGERKGKEGEREGGKGGRGRSMRVREEGRGGREGEKQLLANSRAEDRDRFSGINNKN